jgi:hypothetical protein
VIIRPIEPRDHEKVKALHVSSPAKYELPDFAGQNFIAGWVMVDEEDEPRVLLCFRRTAEAYVVVDHAWDAPAMRLVALKGLIDAATPAMEALGYEDAIGTVGPDVSRSYLRRLQQFGCEVFDGWAIVKMLRRGRG